MFSLMVLMVLAYISGTSTTILNVGDSRAYFYGDGTIIQLTSDHSEGQRMLDLGLLSRTELFKFPARAYLNRYLGCGGEGFQLQADEYLMSEKRGILILCSDGISDFLSENKMVEILLQTENLEAAGRKMVEEATGNSNSDNATIILIPLEEDENVVDKSYRTENTGLYSKGKAWLRHLWNSL